MSLQSKNSLNTARHSDIRFNDVVSVDEINEAVDNLSVEELVAICYEYGYFY